MTRDVRTGLALDSVHLGMAYLTEGGTGVLARAQPLALISDITKFVRALRQPTPTAVPDDGDADRGGEWDDIVLDPFGGSGTTLACRA